MEMCTSNELFRIRPAVGILEPQRNEDVKVIFNACKILPEDSKHYSVVYHISAKNDVSAKKRRMYGELRATILQSRQCIIISSKDPVRSPECGCRILYRKRGQRMLMYDAR
uniref:MSP domain-containing protein n=1 Tax=Ditylenchus dipsaci TaxID=166011 RepID=A0A915EJS7_9BILA